MSNQCSIFHDSRSFSVFNRFLKPYSTLRPILQLRCNLVITSRRSRRGSKFLRHPRPLAAQSSADIDLIETTEHHDGSLIFRFGVVSDVQEEKELVGYLEQETKEGSNIVKIFDGDQEREVIVKTIEREDGRDDGRPVEAVDDNGNVDIDSDIVEGENTVVQELSDYQTESSLIPSENAEKSSDILSENAEKEQVFFSESQGKIDEIKDSNFEDELHEVEPEDNSESDTKDIIPFATMQISDMEVTKATAQDMEDGLKDLNIDERTLPPSDPLDSEQSDPLGTLPILEEVSELQPDPVKVELNRLVPDVDTTDAKDQNLEDVMELVNVEVTGENNIKGVVPITHSLETTLTPDVEAGRLKTDPDVEPSMQVSIIEAMDSKDQVMKDELQQMNIDNGGEDSIMDVMPVSHMSEAEPILDEEISHLLSAPERLEPSEIEIRDLTVQNMDYEISKITDEDTSEIYINDLLPSSQPSEAQPVQDEGESHETLDQSAEANRPESSVTLKQEVHDTLLEAESNEIKVDSSELTEVSGDRAIDFITEASVKRQEISLSDYLLSSGAALLAHPSKALAGGDNAYFVGGSKWLGVADGVSRWSLEGTDSGVYAQELIGNCEKIVQDSSIALVSNPVELLSRGVRETHASGSSSVLLAQFDGQALHVANVGDTGFMIIRHGAIYKKSSPLLHDFNFPVRIGRGDDPLQLLEEYRIELDEGDTVICATDGLFDNLYEQEIAMIVSKSLQAAMKPEEIANILATRAQEVGRSTFIRSPFADAAKAAGYIGYADGKPDDIAVIVSFVKKRLDLHTE